MFSVWSMYSTANISVYIDIYIGDISSNVLCMEYVQYNQYIYIYIDIYIDDISSNVLCMEYVQCSQYICIYTGLAVVQVDK